MSFEITTGFVQQYSSNMMMLGQQRMSRFERAVTIVPITGKRGSVDQVGQSETVTKTERHGRTPYTPLPHRRRWISLDTEQWADLIDDPDKVRMLVDPTSTYAMAGIAAMNRAKDRKIVNAFFATATTGEDGTSTVAFPAANQVAVNSWAYGSGSGNAGLTISKLIEARALLFGYEAVDEMDDQNLADASIAVTKKQWGELLSTTEATSRDFAGELQALKEGKLKRFMGFEFIRYEGLPLNGSNQFRVPVWQKQGMALGKGGTPKGRITEREDLSYTTQVFWEDNFGAARIEENRVVEIICA
jgi:hypothetical protein